MQERDLSWEDSGEASELKFLREQGFESRSLPINEDRVLNLPVFEKPMLALSPPTH